MKLANLALKLDLGSTGVTVLSPVHIIKTIIYYLKKGTM